LPRFADTVGKFLDRMIGIVAPRVALARMSARQLSCTMESWGSNSPGGYDGGKLNRLTKGWMGRNINENAVPRGQIDQLRWNSWELYRNNPHARKILRSLEAKVIGRGLKPESQAVRRDGSAHAEFREAVNRLWAHLADKLDVRGRPGQGGLHIADLEKLAFRSAVLGGDCLYSLKRPSMAKAEELGLKVPIQIRLIHAQRLANVTQSAAGSGNEIYHGIELDGDGRRVAYYLYERHPAEPFWGVMNPQRWPAQTIGHLYYSDDIDELRGTPWFAAALLQMRDTQDYQYNELKASALAACIVLGYRRATGQTTGPALNPPEAWDLNDADGNKITHIQPGMLLDLGMNGEITGFNPARPSTSAEAWINHLIRSTATAIPGVKGSTLTGDYRNSSFSSERSADNDAWPELEGVQDWVAFNFLQPIYQEIIRTALLAGYFDGIITESEFADDEESFTSAHWQGPVALSINQVDDAKASSLRIAGAQSSPQIEAAKTGGNWRRILRDVAEYRKEAVGLGLPEAWIDAIFGVKVTEQTDGASSAADEGDAGDGSSGTPAGKPAKKELANA
jgi:lambda family phage portal protein